MRFSEPHWAVYVCASPVDFRKGLASLVVLVESQLKLDPFAEAFYVFTNRTVMPSKSYIGNVTGFAYGKNAWNKTVSYGRKPMRRAWSRCPPNTGAPAFFAKAEMGSIRFQQRKICWRLMPSAARIRPRFTTMHNSPSVRCTSRLPK